MKKKEIIIISIMVIAFIGLIIFLTSAKEENPNRNTITDYTKKLKEIAENYNLKLSGGEEEYTIKIKNGEQIEIGFENDGDEGDDFGVTYTKKHDGKPFDLELFTKVANVSSKKQITIDFCEKLLKGKEEKYQENASIGRPEEAKIFKVSPTIKKSNFSLQYILWDDKTEQLELSDDTKAPYYINTNY